jgi:hypothetical protein
MSERSTQIRSAKLSGADQNADKRKSVFYQRKSATSICGTDFYL